MIEQFKITDFIHRKNNLVNKNDCDYFISIFKKYEHSCKKESSLKYNEETNTKQFDNYKALDIGFLNYNNLADKDMKEAVILATKYINIMIASYTDYLKSKISNSINDIWFNSISRIRILEYKEGCLIKDHLDVSNTHRASCSLNLNEDYKGGEFTFFSGKHTETFKTGDAMIFPAEPVWIHGTKPILSGTRYCISAFLKSNINAK